MPTPTPHDALFKAIFGRPDIARSELELVLPDPIRARLDLSTLVVIPGSFIDEALVQTHSDLLYAVQTISGEPALACILAEHQSTFDPTMPLRLLEYAVRVWRQWLVDHSGGKLPLLICVVLHHGDRKWSEEPELASMLGTDAESLEATRAFTPHFRFILDDLTALSLEVLARRTLHVLGRLAQIAFWTATDTERFARAAPLMQELAKTVTRDESTKVLLGQLYAYLFQMLNRLDHRTAYDRILKIAGPEGAKDMMWIADEWRAEASVKTARRIFEKMLSVRGISLSDAAWARVLACTDPEELERWCERGILAKNEADIFGTP